MRKLLSIVSLLAVLIVPFGINAAQQNSHYKHTFKTNLSGQFEVPPVTTDMTGETTVHVSMDENTLHYSLLLEDAEDVTMAHLHCAPMGLNGPAIVTLYNNESGVDIESGVLASGEVTQEALLPPASECHPTISTIPHLVQAIREGMVYVNVHTTQNPQGEVRGQLTMHSTDNNFGTTNIKHVFEVDDSIFKVTMDERSIQYDLDLSEYNDVNDAVLKCFDNDQQKIVAYLFNFEILTINNETLSDTLTEEDVIQTTDCSPDIFTLQHLIQAIREGKIHLVIHTDSNTNGIDLGIVGFAENVPTKPEQPPTSFPVSFPDDEPEQPEQPPASYPSNDDENENDEDIYKHVYKVGLSTFKISLEEDFIYYHLMIDGEDNVNNAILRCGINGSTVVSLFNSDVALSVNGEIIDGTINEEDIEDMNECTPEITDLSQLVQAIREGMIYLFITTDDFPQGMDMGMFNLIMTTVPVAQDNFDDEDNTDNNLDEIIEDDYIDDEIEEEPPVTPPSYPVDEVSYPASYAYEFGVGNSVFKAVQDLSRVDFKVMLDNTMGVIQANLKCGTAGPIVANLFSSVVPVNVAGLLSEGMIVDTDVLTTNDCNGSNVSSVAELVEAFLNDVMFLNVQTEENADGTNEGPIIQQ